MIYQTLQRLWHYFKCVVILGKEIGLKKKSKFGYFGKNSTIMKPFLQLSGCSNIKIGDSTTILSNARLAVYGSGSEANITIGNNCYIGFGFSALASAEANISIGDNVLFASNVLVTNENHGIDPKSDIPYMDQKLSARDVVIGNGCWIGEKACILSGVTIGEKCIIGAGSIVTKSIPSYSIAVGNPARIIKQYNFQTKRWERYYGEDGTR